MFLPESVTATRLDPKQNGEPFLELVSDRDQRLLVVVAAPERAPSAIRVLSSQNEGGINGAAIQLAAHVPVQVRADVLYDRRDWPRVGSGEVLQIPPISFTYAVFSVSESDNPLGLSLAVGTDPVLSCIGDLGWIVRPPLGYQVVTARMPAKVMTEQGFSDGAISLYGSETWLEVDVALAGAEKWSITNCLLGAMPPKDDRALDLRLLVLGAGAGWHARPLQASELNAVLQIGVRPRLTPAPAQKTEAMVGPYSSFDECVASELQRDGSLGKARATCRAFAQGSARRG